MALTGLVTVKKDGSSGIMIKSPFDAQWNGSVNVTTNPALKQLLHMSDYIHETITEMANKGKLTMVRISAMMINGNFIKLSELYPKLEGDIGYIIGLYKDNGKSSIITMDARNVFEIERAGYDSYQHCRIPVIFVRETINGNKRFKSINLC